MSASESRTVLSRRRLLERGLVLGAVAGASSMPGANSAFAAERTVGGTLSFLSWQGYDIPKSSKPWKTAHHVTLKPTYLSTPDDTQAKILALRGGKGYDVITYYQGYKDLYRTLKILQPLDPEKIPNYKNLLPLFRSRVGNYWVEPDGTLTGVPMYFGGVGLTYDAGVITKPPTSYDILLDKKWTGKVTLADDPVGAFSQAGHVLGVDVAKMTPKDFEKVSAWLKALIAQTKGVAPTYGDVASRLASGDAVLAFLGWAAMDVFAAAAGKKTVRSVLPKEGGYSTVDAWAIPISAKNIDTAYGWINNAITPRVNALAAMELGGGGVTVARSVPLLDPATRGLYPYKHFEAYLEKAPLYGNPPVKSSTYVTIDKVIAKWQALKAG